MADQRVGGTIQLQVAGEIQLAKGEFTYSLGTPIRTEVKGQDRMHGFTEEPGVPYVEGTITDRKTLKVKDLCSAKDITVTLQLANGKTVTLGEAWYSGDPKVTTKEGEITVKWTGMSAEEV